MADEVGGLPACEERQALRRDEGGRACGEDDGSRAPGGVVHDFHLYAFREFVHGDDAARGDEEALSVVRIRERVGRGGGVLKDFVVRAVRAARDARLPG